MRTIILVVGLFLITSCKHPSKEDQHKCIELPDYVIKLTKFNNEKFIVKCYLDDNSIHRFKDGSQFINIVPSMLNESTNKAIYVDKETLIGYDTIDLDQQLHKSAKLIYSITFPSPKGGDVKITKAVDIDYM